MTYLIRPKLQSDKFVTFWGGFKDGRGLGNQMFNIAAMVYVAELSGRRPIMEKVGFTQMVDEVFNLTAIPRSMDVCPCFQYNEISALRYDPRVEELGQPQHESSAEKRTIVIQGFFQSWKYMRGVETRLRKEFFQFRPELKTFAENFLSANYPPRWTQAFVRVAVHVRRGDNLNQDKIDFGYVIPEGKYFRRAMGYFAENYGRVQFVVVSQDEAWTRHNVVAPEGLKEDQVNVTYVFGNSRGQDMALLAACDHLIMSTGTFGWWAGFLAKGSTVYFSDWPRPGSQLHSLFKKEDFFPPAWIPM